MRSARPLRVRLRVRLRVPLRVAALVGALVTALPSFGTAQPGRGAPPADRPEAGGPPAGRPGPRAEVGGVTRILNLRRVLELTPRQVAQLDSIERALVAERRPALERMRAEREGRWRAEGGRLEGRPLPPDSVRARLTQARPQLEQFRRSDSVATAAAERILTETQRARWRELRAYARGRADATRGMRGVRGGMRGGMRGSPRGPGAMGPRAGRGPTGMRLEGRPMRPQLEGMPLEAPLAPLAPMAPRRPRPPVE